jgi:O-antigen/teichoic acid export membrane protein
MKGAGWTVGAYGLGQLFRLVTNVALARLLAPELFGIMVIVNSLRTGIDMISDVGIAQNIVHNRNADNPDFYNTAWTIRLIRGLLLWFVCLAAAVPIARFYEAPILASVMPVAGLFFVLAGLGSMALPLLQRRLRYARLNAFEVFTEFVATIVHVTFAYLTQTVWALVLGGLVAFAARMAGSYFLLPGLWHRLQVSKEYAKQIFTFGKWIFLSSIVYFFSVNFDRLYLGKVATLEILGVYGIARSLSEVASSLVLRLCNYLIFPLVASSQHVPRDRLREHVAPIRLTFLLVAAFGLSLFAALADVLVGILYDQRYQAAGWMLPVLIIGVWFGIVVSINESTLMGFGKPSYGAVANSVKFVLLLIGLPLAFAAYGAPGAVAVVAAGDLSRYIPILVGQLRERFSFVAQDFWTTLFMLGSTGLWEGLRSILGFGTSLDGLRVAVSS